MTRPTRLLLAALPLTFALGACGGGGDATQGSVRDQVKGTLLETRNEDDDADNNLTDEEAGAIADCVARALFESGEFSRDERNEAASAADGEDPDPDLVAKVQRVIDDCVAGDGTDDTGS
jgi:hypothetical protein